MSPSRSEPVSTMDLLRHWRITVCPRCDVQIGGGGHCWECGSRGVKPVPRSVEVEVVPALTPGAVSAEWREAAYQRIRRQHFMEAFDAESRDDLARWIADAVIEAWPAEQLRGTV